MLYEQGKRGKTLKRVREKESHKNKIKYILFSANTKIYFIKNH
jgi:hypothetical protein